MSMVPDLARRSWIVLTTRETFVGRRSELEVLAGWAEARLCSSALAIEGPAMVEVPVNWCCRVRGLTSPSGDG